MEGSGCTGKTKTNHAGWNVHDLNCHQMYQYQAIVHDTGLPPPKEDCPVWFLPLPIRDYEHIYQACCGKIVCSGCMLLEARKLILEYASCLLPYAFWWWAPTPLNLSVCALFMQCCLNSSEANTPLSVCYCLIENPDSCAMSSNGIFPRSVSPVRKETWQWWNIFSLALSMYKNPPL